jgi:hypothetical protein
VDRKKYGAGAPSALLNSGSMKEACQLLRRNFLDAREQHTDHIKHTFNLKDFWFLQQCEWGISCPGMLCCITGYLVPAVLRYIAVSYLRIKISKKNQIPTNTALHPRSTDLSLHLPFSLKICQNSTNLNCTRTVISDSRNACYHSTQNI